MILAILLGVYLKSITGPIVVGIGVIIALTGLDKHVVLALVFAVALGCAVGIFIGWLVADVGIPSFIVTLALFLAFQGVLLFALKSQPIGVNNYNFWYGLAHDNMSPVWSWVLHDRGRRWLLRLHGAQVAAGAGQGPRRRQHRAGRAARRRHRRSSASSSPTSPTRTATPTRSRRSRACPGPRRSRSR